MEHSVESIGRVQRELQELLPSVRITVAHGAMREAELEKAMMTFYSREADVLLATTEVKAQPPM